MFDVEWVGVDEDGLAAWGETDEMRPEFSSIPVSFRRFHGVVVVRLIMSNYVDPLFVDKE